MGRPFVILAAIGIVSATAAAGATVATPLPVSNLFTKNGKPATLRSGVTYQADRSFPTGLRFTLPDGSWAGAQWRTGRGPGAVGQRKPPFYGWVNVGEGPISAPPLGAVTIMMAWAQSPGVAAIVQKLRRQGHGATYGPTSSVSVGGVTGNQFDATIVGHEHAFIPFSRTSGASRYYSDATFFGKGEHVRVIVLNARGKGVVVYIENARLPLDQFPAFLKRADVLLQTLRLSK